MAIYLGNQLMDEYLGSTDTTIIPNPMITIDYLIIGGGGSAQAYNSAKTCGAGGEGGFISGRTTVIPGYTNLAISVGSRGLRTNGATIADGTGNTGNNSTFLGLTAYGGGGGGNSDGDSGIFVGDGLPGGSGGGAGASQKLSAGSQQASGGTGVAGQGFNGGGSYTAGSNNSPWMAGAGGGAGGPATSASLGEYNTPGIQKAWLDGNEYAGGGWAGGAASQNSSSGSGGNIQNNTTIGTEGFNGLVKVRYASSVALFTGGDILISGGYVYHSFNAVTQSAFAPGVNTDYIMYYTG
jgi:hypothetical protein